MPSLKTFAERTGLPRENRWSSVYAKVREMAAARPTPAPAAGAAPARQQAGPAIRRVAPWIEEIAAYLVRGFHDWEAEANWPPKHHYLEPGIRRLYDYVHARTGKAVTELDPEWATEGEHLRFTPNAEFPVKRENITVRLSPLRDDWEDEFRWALDQYRALGLNFVEVDWEPDYGRMHHIPDVQVDDERAGSYLFSNFSTAIDGVGQRYVGGAPVVHTSLRKINVAKRTPDRSVRHHFLHELGHALGLGHPGPYPQCEVDPAGIGAPSNCGHMGHVGMRKVSDPRIFEADDVSVTIMSYFGGGSDALGEADRVAIERIYGTP